MNLEFLSILLNKKGYDTFLAQNGKKALDMAVAELPDLILLDVNMPGLDGYEVCRKLKLIPSTKNIPVIFISGTGNEQKGLSLGAVDYIRKPFSNAIITARVKNHIKLKQYQNYLETQVRERTRELRLANMRLEHEISERIKAEASLKKYQTSLEELVEQRTKELIFSNRMLQREIIEREETEVKLRESEQKYRSLFENTGSATLIMENDMTISEVNSEYEKLTGYMKNEIEGKTKWTKVIHREDIKRLKKYHKLRRRGNGLAPSEYECKIVDAKGEVKNILARVDMIPGTRQSVASWIDITHRKRSEAALKESEQYLRTIMETIQTGVLITDPETGKIVDANSYAKKMLGHEIKEIEGKPYWDYVKCEPIVKDDSQIKPLLKGETKGTDCIIHKANGKKIHVRRSFASARLKNREHIIQSFLDITDIKELLKRQDINIELSKTILNLVNLIPQRHTHLSDSHLLFFGSFSSPCYKQGGDHYFVRTVGSGSDNARTFISLKDQSGHKVGCVLRSIITDMIHHGIISRYPLMPLDRIITLLNKKICESQIFAPDDFCTSFNFEICHNTLKMRYLANGHPPAVLLRGKEIKRLPLSPADAKGSAMPIGFLGNADFISGSFQLKSGDRLILYTDGLTEMPFKRKNRILTHKDVDNLLGMILDDNEDTNVLSLTEFLVDVVSGLSDEKPNPTKTNSSGDDITILCLEIENKNMYEQKIFSPRNIDEAAFFIKKLYKKISAQWEMYGFQEPATRLWTALEEGILNAWIHGNKQIPTKCITVRWRFGNDFHIEIKDQGNGFFPETIEDPSKTENINKTSGRGIFMIRFFADSIRWGNNGTRLIVTFKKHPAPGKDDYLKKITKVMELLERP